MSDFDDLLEQALRLDAGERQKFLQQLPNAQRDELLELITAAESLSSNPVDFLRPIQLPSTNPEVEVTFVSSAEVDSTENTLADSAAAVAQQVHRRQGHRTRHRGIATTDEADPRHDLQLAL